MNTKISPSYFLISLIAVSAVLAFFIFRPFLIALVLAAVFATVLYPLYREILRSMDNSPGLAAFITIVISVTCILVPFTFIATQIAGDAQQVYNSFADGSAQEYSSTLFQNTNDIVERYAPSLAALVPDFSSSIHQYIQSGLQWLIQNLGGIFGGATRFFVSLFIFLIALYYLLRDGSRLKEVIIKVIPLASADSETVFARLKLAVGHR